jgi:hypothetical protein
MGNDQHGSWAALKEIAAPDGIGGHFLLREPRLAHYILPNTSQEEVVAVEVRGVTDSTYFRRNNRNKIEVTFPGKKERHFLNPRVVKYPITGTGR